MDDGLLYAAINALREEALGYFSGKELEDVRKTISSFAIYSAASGVLANFFPDFGGIAAAITQTSLVWVLYVRINKSLGIEMSESVAKFLGSAVLTNLMTNAGSFVIGFAVGAVTSFIPIIGQLTAAAVDGALGFILIYVSAVIYLRILTQVMKVKGKIELTGTKEEEVIVQGVLKEMDLKKLIQEAKEQYKAAKASGAIQTAITNKKCPVCGNAIEPDQDYCTNCGLKLK